MLYYKSLDGNYYASSSPITRGELQEITEQEYDDAIKELELQKEPSEEEIRAAKEAQLSQLIRELYPEEFSDEK